MKISAFRHVMKCALLTAVCGCLATHAAEMKSKAVCATPKAVFVDDPASGADPFFPTSKRRLERLPHPVVPSAVVQVAPVWEHIKLQGMSGLESQRLALVNGATIAAGEFAEIKCDGKTVRVRCREIRDRSILLEIVDSGETRELKLRDNI